MNTKTTQRSFNGDFEGNDCMFSVNAGIDKGQALRQASCVVVSVRQALTRAICDGREIDANEAFLLREALWGAEALLEACE